VALANYFGLSNVNQAFHECRLFFEVEEGLSDARWSGWKRRPIELSLQVGDNRLLVRFLLINATEQDSLAFVVSLKKAGEWGTSGEPYKPDNQFPGFLLP
jgi:hypothetical protein